MSDKKGFGWHLGMTLLFILACMNPLMFGLWIFMLIAGNKSSD